MDNYFETFNKTFAIDQSKMINGIELTIRKDDGYVNISSLCLTNKKQFQSWYRNESATEFLNVLTQEMQSEFELKNLPIPKLVDMSAVRKNGTFVHPLVAIKIAQWISPKFDVAVTKWIYQLFLTGSVDISKQSMAELEEIRKEKIQLEQNYKKIQVNHEKLKQKKTHPKVEKGMCLYIIGIGNESYKFGITSDLNNRLQAYRTSIPNIKMERIVYIKEAKQVEDAIKFKFENNHIPYNNHEIFMGDLRILTAFINKYVDTFGLEYTDAVEEVANINQFMTDISKPTTHLTTIVCQGDYHATDEERVLPLSAFSKYCYSANGYRSRCKECENQSTKDYQKRLKKVDYSTIPLDKTQVCTKCHKELNLLNDFQRHTSRKTGFDSFCKDCRRSRAAIQKRLWKETNKLKKDGIITIQEKKSKSSNIKKFDYTIIDDNHTLTCTYCKQILPALASFSKREYSKTGFQSRCRKCQNQIAQEKKRKSNL